MAELKSTLEAAYDGKLRDHLVDIEATALASASFGQVHRARTIEGHEVAVKIQYPNLRPAVAVDIATVRMVTWLLKPFLPGWPLEYIAEEIERSSREELDYLFEGRNGDLLRKGLADQGLRVPEIYWQHCREKVLVMEFAPGKSLAQYPTNTLPATTRQALAETLIDGFLHQLLVERFFHADPHGGNVLLDVADDGSWHCGCYWYDRASGSERARLWPFYCACSAIPTWSIFLKNSVIYYRMPTVKASKPSPAKSTLNLGT